jgi:hypothetical protein
MQTSQSELNLIDRVALASPYSVENCFQRLVDTKSQDGENELVGGQWPW